MKRSGSRCTAFAAGFQALLCVIRKAAKPELLARLIGVNVASRNQREAFGAASSAGGLAMTSTMMTFDILLLVAAAVSTVLILFGVVIMGDYESQHQHAKASVQPRTPHLD